MKKCKKCRLLKDLNDFMNVPAMVSGKSNTCKKCKLVMDNVSRKARIMKLICEKCNTQFIHNTKSKKFCEECSRNNLTYDFCEEVISKYINLTDLQENYEAVYKKCLEMGWEELLKSLQKRNASFTEEHCFKVALQYTTKTDLRNNHNSIYNKIYRQKWYYMFNHMVPLHTKYTHHDCLTTALKYKTITEMARTSPREYEKIKREGWEDTCFLHMTVPTKGWDVKRFISDCNRNNNGLGILYLIKCSKVGETFYKIGLTSLSVVKRYQSDPAIKNYQYSILWQIEGDPETLFKLETDIKTKTKKLRYQPAFWPHKSRETFKCHGNSKLLREPNLI